MSAWGEFEESEMKDIILHNLKDFCQWMCIAGNTDMTRGNYTNVYIVFPNNLSIQIRVRQDKHDLGLWYATFQIQGEAHHTFDLEEWSVAIRCSQSVHSPIKDMLDDKWDNFNFVFTKIVGFFNLQTIDQHMQTLKKIQTHYDYQTWESITPKQKSDILSDLKEICKWMCEHGEMNNVGIGHTLSIAFPKNLDLQIAVRNDKLDSSLWYATFKIPQKGFPKAFLHHHRGKQWQKARPRQEINLKEWLVAIRCERSPLQYMREHDWENVNFVFVVPDLGRGDTRLELCTVNQEMQILKNTKNRCEEVLGSRAEWWRRAWIDLRGDTTDKQWQFQFNQLPLRKPDGTMRDRREDSTLLAFKSLFINVFDTYVSAKITQSTPSSSTWTAELVFRNKTKMTLAIGRASKTELWKITQLDIELDKSANFFAVPQPFQQTLDKCGIAIDCVNIEQPDEPMNPMQEMAEKEDPANEAYKFCYTKKLDPELAEELKATYANISNSIFEMGPNTPDWEDRALKAAEKPAEKPWWKIW